MEKTSTLIDTRTTLPPMLEGPIMGHLKVHIPFLTLNKALTPSETVSVKFRWWGEQQTFTIFKPLFPGRSQHDLKTIAIFSVCCSLDMILSYLKDINELKFEVASNFGRASQRLGLVFVAIESIKFGTPLAGLYPIKINNEIIGEMFVSLILENFKSKPEKEIEDSLRNEYIDAQVTTLRKDTNNVLNQILSKAKDLRMCLQSTNEQTSNVSFNLSQRNIGFSLTQLLLERNETKIKKSFELLHSTNNSEEDSLPDESVLNSILYSKPSEDQYNKLKDTVETQTEDVSSQIMPDSDQSNDVKNAMQTSPKRIDFSANGLQNRLNYETLKDYAYLKVTVDMLNIGSCFKSAGWVFSVEVHVPWVGRDSAISWNREGHRTYNDFSSFHLLSDKVKNEAVTFKQERVFPYYYCPELVLKHLEKSIDFIVEARNTHKKTKKHLGKGYLKLDHILNHNMKLTTDLKLTREPDFGVETVYTLKVILKFLKISKRSSISDEAQPNKNEVKETLVIGCAPTLPRRSIKCQESLAPRKPKNLDESVQLDMPANTSTKCQECLAPSKPKCLDKGVQLDELPKVDFESRTNIIPLEIQNNSREINYNNCLDVLLSINEAIRLPIVYDSQSRNTYYSPSTYVTCKIGDNIVSTHVSKNTTNPVWNCIQKTIIPNQNYLVFKLHLNCQSIKDIQNDKVLGFATIDLRPLYKIDHLKGSYLINNENGEDCGELKIDIWKNQKVNLQVCHNQNTRNLPIKVSDDGLKGTRSSRLKVNEFLKRSISKLNTT